MLQSGIKCHIIYTKNASRAIDQHSWYLSVIALPVEVANLDIREVLFPFLDRNADKSPHVLAH